MVGLRSLVDSPVLRQLTELKLYGNRIESAGAEALAGAGPLPALRHLSLGCSPLGAGGAALAAIVYLALHASSAD